MLDLVKLLIAASVVLYQGKKLFLLYPAANQDFVNYICFVILQGVLYMEGQH